MLAAVVATGQDTHPQFEVASIKAHAGSAGPIKLVLNFPERFSAENVWVKLLIRIAWDVRDFQIVGAPSWVNSDRFDIEAVSNGKTSPAEKRQMLRSLLEERFQVKLHRETRQMPVYELIPAKGGPKMHEPTEGSCVQPDPNTALRPLAPGQEPTLYCGNLRSGARQIEGSAIQMSSFTVWLSDVLQRPVVDRTGFTGTFNVNLKWSDDQVNLNSAAPATQPVDIDSGAPSIFTALREQLGLRLESTKGPVEVLVIDHAEPPTQN